MGKGAYKLAHDDKAAAEQRHIATAEQIRQRTDKGAHGGRGQQVAGN